MTTKKQTKKAPTKKTRNELVKRFQQLWPEQYAGYAPETKCFVAAHRRELSSDACAVWRVILDSDTLPYMKSGVLCDEDKLADFVDGSSWDNVGDLWDDNAQFVHGKDAIAAARRIIQEVRPNDVLCINADDNIAFVTIRDMTCKELNAVLEEIEDDASREAADEGPKSRCKTLIDQINRAGPEQIKAIQQILSARPRKG